ncbi:AAA family ATPase [Clostridium pasteurianum]|uniref:TrlF family AAA-like ATPase n=1 Tax=Clostridium pasteurianum TaxID=1501 RepID=UPI002260AEE7|nr:AAA family ATPase [Clostridium pasteurianum]UZW12548.1 AAA family ATPase [Clostridium pasteurianum]
MGIAKWRKIDFHTHTPESRCFKNRNNVNSKQWIDAVMKSGLDAVVVTDHNSVGWIDRLRNELKDNKDLFIFPGIEFCVGTSFTHILVIFDPKMKIEDIEGFVMQCGLLKSDWGDTTKCIDEKTFSDVIKKYREKVLIIPAHFNEEKGLCKTIGQNGIKEFYSKINFDAIEVRNENDINEVNNKIKNEIIPNMAVVTGSDNPGNNTGEHDLINFGKAYTWIKLSEFSLEGLRQAFLDYETRSYCVLSNGNLCEDKNIVKHNYISGMKIANLKHIDELNFRLSPNLNCIIGGRGSGKSTIVEMIRLAFKQYDEKKKNHIINNTYRDDTNIDVYYKFGSISEYCVHVKGKKNEKIWNVESDDGITNDIPKFPISIYSQKELFNIIEDENNSEKNENSPLLEIIDENVSLKKSEVYEKIATIRKEILTLVEEINVIRNQTREIKTLKAEIELSKSKLSKLQNTGIIDKRNELMTLKEAYNRLKEILKENISLLDDMAKSFERKVIQSSERDSKLLNNEINNKYIKDNILNINHINENLLKSMLESKFQLENENKKIEENELKIIIDKKQVEYNKLLDSINGINIDDYKIIENEINEKNIKLIKLTQKELEENLCVDKIRDKIQKYIEAYEELSNLRRGIIETINDRAVNIQLKINTMSNSDKWLSSIRSELGKSNNFDSEFEKIKKKIFKQNGGIRKDEFQRWLEFLTLKEDASIKNYLNVSNCDVRFEKLWLDKKKENTIQALINFIPEDKVEIKIINKINKRNKININEASPGQKSAAILAFILNQGDSPLIIDQPEDDLDNSLIIDLVVESIRNTKNSRQIIIVTHNPNIPVLGDAEGIVILDRSQNGKVIFKNGKKTGCIEEKMIKEGICEIMEGGIQSFKFRENKYKYIK